MAGLAAYQKVVDVKTTAEATRATVPGSNATMNFAGEQLDDSTFESGAYRSRVQGLKDYSFTLTLVYDSADTGYTKLQTAMLNGSRLDIRYLPNGTNGFAGTVVVENFTHSGSVDGLETVEVSLQASNAALTTV